MGGSSPGVLYRMSIQGWRVSGPKCGAGLSDFWSETVPEARDSANIGASGSTIGGDPDLRGPEPVWPK